MDFQTPPKICKIMAEMILLIPNGKTILEPTPGEGNLVEAIRNLGYNVVVPPNSFWDIFGWFDAIVMNPPFSPMKTGYEILYQSMKMADIIIALMPWLTIINSEKRTNDIKEFGLKSITHLPRNVFPGSRVQTCILQMEKGYAGFCEFKIL